MNNDISMEYAGAFFMLAREQDKLDLFNSDLAVVQEVFAANPEYADMLCSPNLSCEEKVTAVNQAFSGRVEDDVVSFLSLITEKGRMDLLPAIIEGFKTLYDMSRKHIIAVVRSVTPLTEDEQSKLIEKLSAQSGCSVSLDMHIDKSLIGGMIIEMNGTVIDGSIKSRLSEIKRVLTDESKT